MEHIKRLAIGSLILAVITLLSYTTVRFLFLPYMMEIVFASAILWLVYFLGKLFIDVYRETNFEEHRND